MLKIRLMRIGAKGQPFYRVVVVDERNKRNGAYLDLIGTYNPLTEPKEIKLDKQKLEDWVKKGAQKSDGLLRILKEAPQKHRKPKKEQPVEAAPAPKTEEAVAEAPASEETPAETPAEQPVEETPAEAPEQATEAPTEEVTTEETPSEEPQAEEQIATEPEAPRNDEGGEEKSEEEGNQ